MSGYTPSPDDLEPVEMPEEWRQVADGVLPFNRERLAEAFAEAAKSYGQIAVTLRLSLAPFAEAMKKAAAAIARLHRRYFSGHRTGHRHAGTQGHRLRYAPRPKGVPLGQRTFAKLATPPSPESPA